MSDLYAQKEKRLYDMLIKAFYGYKLHLANEPTPDPYKFEEMAYRSYHMLPTDYTKVEFNFLKHTIHSIVGEMLNCTDNKVGNYTDKEIAQAAMNGDFLSFGEDGLKIIPR